jgi:hypothetical protein
MPFMIEYVALFDVKEPRVVERVTSFASRLAYAEQSAEAGLARIRQLRPDTSPHGFQIRDNAGDVILRSWEKAVDAA